MTMEIPSAPKVYTTVYDNFKGVDYTNDSTNIWRRRSPTGYNMLPDESGRPFKRTGWEVMISSEDFANFITGEYTVFKCHYFELAGKDFIVIFTTGGVFLYDGALSILTDDVDACYSYERAFFFEGNGKSAFYIYGNYKVWEYGYEDGFYFKQSTDLYIPRILVTTDPSTCTGVTYEDYNMIFNKVTVEYQTNNMCFAVYVPHVAPQSIADIVEVNIETETFKTKVGTTGTYEFVYDETNEYWELNGTQVTLSEYGISTIGTSNDADMIKAIYEHGVLLANNVAQTQYQDVKVYVSTTMQFDTELEVLQDGNQPDASSCVLVTDNASFPIDNRKAFIIFDSEHTQFNGQEDSIRVTFPTTAVDITSYSPADTVNTGTASIVRG